jgi:hypothetical protein
MSKHSEHRSRVMKASALIIDRCFHGNAAHAETVTCRAPPALDFRIVLLEQGRLGCLPRWKHQLDYSKNASI